MIDRGLFKRVQFESIDELKEFIHEGHSAYYIPNFDNGLIGIETAMTDDENGGERESVFFCDDAYEEVGNEDLTQIIGFICQHP